MQSTYDAVVIGAGFGGAITACRLAQAGQSVCVLERGKRWHKSEFPRSISQVSKAFWRDHKNYGFLEYHVSKRIDVIQGCGVGGGSLHYFNVHLRALDAIFQQHEWPEKITRQVMEPYYDLVKDMLDAEPLNPPQGMDLPPRTKAFLAAAKKGKREAKLLDIAVYTGEDRNNPHSGIPQSACDYTGNCMLGCRVHAKNSLDLNYIPLAEAHGAQVFPLHMVKRIDQISDQSYKVTFAHLSDEPGDSEPGSVIGKKVIVAAGTLGSNQLLLRCKNIYKTLPKLSAMLGKRFSGNGDFLLSGTLDADQVVDPSQGPSITAYMDFSTENNKIVIEDLGFPDPFLWLLEGVIPNKNRFKNMLRVLKNYILGSFGVGRGSTHIDVELERIFEGGHTSRLLPYLGMGTDAADGSLHLTKDGNIDIDWNHRKSKQMFREMEKALKALSADLNGRYKTSLLWRWPIRKLLTAHPLGGCTMSMSPKTGVVNEFGEVWEYPNLYVADGSIIPTALAVNPSTTIGALAERIAFWIIHDREMQANDPKLPKNA
jgi:cholesterol oxidase